MILLKLFRELFKFLTTVLLLVTPVIIAERYDNNTWLLLWVAVFPVMLTIHAHYELLNAQDNISQPKEEEADNGNE